MPGVYNNDNTTNRRELFKKIEINSRSLWVTGIEERCICILAPVLKNNLPKDVKLLLNGKFDLKKGLWEIEEIMSNLTAELDGKIYCFTERRRKRSKVHCPFHSSTKNLLAVKWINYSYCQTSHLLVKYEVIIKIETRKTLLRSQKTFPNCTRYGKDLKYLRSRKTCFKCWETQQSSISHQVSRSKTDDSEKNSPEDSKKNGKNKKKFCLAHKLLQNLGRICHQRNRNKKQQREWKKSHQKILTKMNISDNLLPCYQTPTKLGR